MDPISKLKHGFELGEWEVRPAEGLLIGLQGRRHLQPKCIDVLMCLAEQAGQVVTREDILRDVWGTRAVTDEPLTRCIGDLRRELGDTREEPRYVQTIPKRGYRLIAKMTPLIGPDSEPSPVLQTEINQQSRFPSFLPTAAAIAGVAAFIAIFVTAQNDDVAEPVPLIADSSIAVLPFEDMSSDPGNAWLGRGIAEDLLNLLTRIEGMDVASRTSSFQPKLQTMDVRDIGAMLNVHYVLEGSVRRSDDRIKIAAQLIDSGTGYHVWSKVYDRTAADVFAIQGEIAERVVKSLQHTTPIGLSLGDYSQATDSIEAYDYYLQARSFLNGPSTDATLENAQRFYERALEFDPEFGEAYAGLCAIHLEAFSQHQAPDALPAAQEACDSATVYAPDSPRTRTAIATLYQLRGDSERALDQFAWVTQRYPADADARIGIAITYADRGDIAAAEQAFLEAIEINPDDPGAYSTYGLFLWSNGRADEAIPMYQRAIDLDPGNAEAYNNIGAAYVVHGDFEQAAIAYREALSRQASSLTYSNIGTNYYYLGRFEDAAVMYREAIGLAPKDFTLWGNLADALAQIPERESATQQAYQRARTLAEQELSVNPSQSYALAPLAHYCARLGDYDCAIERIAEGLNAETTEFYTHYYATLVRLQMDDDRQAIAEIMRAVELGFPLEMLEADPMLAPVRDHQQLVAFIQGGKTARK
jgi:TolB-like protein/tetratricopeptide (TPR) repeat protein/DNA-binding winged helix-turn-helix (wHTH) protein